VEILSHTISAELQNSKRLSVALRPIKPGTELQRLTATALAQGLHCSDTLLPRLAYTAVKTIQSVSCHV